MPALEQARVCRAPSRTRQPFASQTACEGGEARTAVAAAFAAREVERLVHVADVVCRLFVSRACLRTMGDEGADGSRSAGRGPCQTTVRLARSRL